MLLFSSFLTPFSLTQTLSISLSLSSKQYYGQTWNNNNNNGSLAAAAADGLSALSAASTPGYPPQTPSTTTAAAAAAAASSSSIQAQTPALSLSLNPQGTGQECVFSLLLFCLFDKLFVCLFVCLFEKVIFI